MRATASHSQLNVIPCSRYRGTSSGWEVSQLGRGIYSRAAGRLGLRTMRVRPADAGSNSTWPSRVESVVCVIAQLRDCPATSSGRPIGEVKVLLRLGGQPSESTSDGARERSIPPFRAKPSRLRPRSGASRELERGVGSAGLTLAGPGISDALHTKCDERLPGARRLPCAASALDAGGTSAAVFLVPSRQVVHRQVVRLLSRAAFTTA